MHLDGYNELLRLAFEFNGTQHYRIYPKYHKSYSDLLYQQELDEIKAELCRKQGIRLILVPYWLDYDEFQDLIMKEYEPLTNTKLENIPRFDWKSFKLQSKEFK